MGWMRRAAVVVCLVLVLLACGTVVVSWLLPQRAPFCTQVYFDIAGARVQRTTYVLWLPVRTRTEETELSALHRRLVGPLPAPLWQPADTIIPWRSAHYHHGYSRSLYWAELLGPCLNETRFDDEAREAVVLDFLRLLPSRRGAEGYAEQVCDLAGESGGSARAISVEDLPEPAGHGTPARGAE
jgi:hypothetical protein